MLIKNNGFTMIELMLTIGMLSVLAMVALPKLVSVNLTTGRTNARDAMIGAVQAAISADGANDVATGNDVSYPTTLDRADDLTTASHDTPLFSTVLSGGVTSGWTKLDSDCYQYTGDGGTDEFQYDPTNGTFSKVSNCN